MQLKGLDIGVQRAALDPDQQPGFDEQEAAVQMKGEQEDPCPKTGVAVKSVTVESCEIELGTLYVKGTMMMASGEEIAINGSVEYSSAKDVGGIVGDLVGRHGLTKADGEKVRKAIVAKLPK